MFCKTKKFLIGQHQLILTHQHIGQGTGLGPDSLPCFGLVLMSVHLGLVSIHSGFGFDLVSVLIVSTATLTENMLCCFILASKMLCLYRGWLNIEKHNNLPSHALS